MSVIHKNTQPEASTPVSGEARFVAVKSNGFRFVTVLLGSILLAWAAFSPADNLAAATHPATKTTSSIRLSRPTFGTPQVPVPGTEARPVQRHSSASNRIQIIPGSGSHRHVHPLDANRADSRRVARQGVGSYKSTVGSSHNAFQLATQTDAPATGGHSPSAATQPSNGIDRTTSNDAGQENPLSVYPPHQQAKAGVKASVQQTESLDKPDDFSVLPEAPAKALHGEVKIDSSDETTVSTLQPTLDEAKSNRKEEIVAPEPEKTVEAHPSLTLPQEKKSTSSEFLSGPGSDNDTNPFVIPGAIFDAPAVPEAMAPESVEVIGEIPSSPVPEIPNTTQVPREAVVDTPYAGHSIHTVETPISGHVMNRPRPGTSASRANSECDADVWMAPYTSRAGVAGSGTMPNVIGPLSDLPPDYSPWWDAVVRQPSGIANTTLPVDVSMLLQDAMLYSPQVTAIKTEPEVQYRVITQEAAKFDWTAFLETTYDDLNDPAGNNLATGNGEDRLLTRKVRGAGGLRQKNLYGGEFRIAQELGHENQNSRIFIPNNQGTSRLELSYRQPLWDGAGRAYNESEIILARIQANSSEDEVVDALQDHLIEVTEAYWTLYRSRSEFFQRRKLLTSAQHVLARLEGRSQVDTIPRQVLRGRAAVARAQTRIQRTVARVKDAEAQLRLLVNSPGMLNGGPTELMPTEPPTMVTENADLQCVLQTALINRSDISEAIRKMRASSVRLGVSKNELLPRLDFLIETYVADLSGNSDVARSLKGQYVNNRPGFTIGLEFEVPLGNRAANAKLEQRQWELKRSVNVFKATVEKSLTDVEISNREVATAYSEIISRFASMTAAEKESNYLQDRFEVLPASEDSATLLLEDLLDSFERLADEESSFVQALVDHAVALVKLKKELGILLQSRHSRPNVDATHQAWVNDRIQSAVGHTKRTNVKPVSFPQVSQESVVSPSDYYRVQPGTAAATRPAVGVGGYLNP